MRHVRIHATALRVEPHRVFEQVSRAFQLVSILDEFHAWPAHEEFEGVNRDVVELHGSDAAVLEEVGQGGRVDNEEKAQDGESSAGRGLDDLDIDGFYPSLCQSCDCATLGGNVYFSSSV